MTLSLRRRILLAVLPFLLLLAGLGGAGAALMVQLGQRSAAILRENYDSVKAMALLNEALDRVDSSFQFALAGKEANARAAYATHWDRYQEQLAVEENNVTIYPDEPRLVAELQALTTRYRARAEQFFAHPAGDAARQKEYFGTETEPGLLQLFGSIKQVSAAIHALNEQQMQQASRQAQATARDSIVGFSLGLGLAALLAAVTVWWLLRALLGPIHAVTEAAQLIGGGQLHLSVPVYGSDEMGQLAEAFNAMTRKLRAYRQTNTEKLLRAQATSQATIDSFADPVVVVDLLGRVEFANQAARRVLGVSSARDGQDAPWQPPEPLHRPLAEALQQRPYLTETFDQAVSFRLDGDDRAYLPQVRPIRAADGETLGAAVVLNDVTRFRLLDRLKSDWVATVSHELKTPLTSVRLAVHVLLEEAVGPLEPKQIELLLEARESTERLFRLIEQLLALARLEDSRDQLHPISTDPMQLLRDAADTAAPRAEDRHVAIVVTDADLPPVLADPTRLGHALNNLLDNALTYTEPGGTVTLAAERTAAGVRLTVADTGIGIPAEYLPHVFDRFFRVPGRDHQPGTGLGLAIVREIVAAHHGTITCESEAGRGTAFHLTLPLAEATP